MNDFALCPRCESELPTRVLQVAHCSCGWHDSRNSEKLVKRAELRAAGYLVLAAIGVLVGIAHVGKWGGDALTVPLLRAATIVGALPASGYETLAQACLSRSEIACAESAFRDEYKKRKSVEALGHYGHLELRLKKKADAFSAFDSYFAAGGTDPHAMLEFAQLLEERRMNQRALKFYEQSIALQPEVLPVQATAGIIHILISEGHKGKARNRILAFHQSAENAKGYFNTELAQLTDQSRMVAGH